MNYKRRELLRRIVIGAGLSQAGVLAPAVFAEARDQGGLDALLGGSDPSCPFIGITEDGPLYPPGEIPWLSDLARSRSGDGVADGQIMYLFGRVLDPQCRPLSGAIVEVWQTDSNGNYKHPVAPHQNKLDPNFQYFGKVRTALDGSYLFRTIVPRWYNLFGNDRAAHVHIKIRHSHHGVLTTEMYFEGEEQDRLRKCDVVYQSRFEQIKSRIVVAKEAPSSYRELKLAFEPSAVCCRYDLAFLM